MSVFGRALGLCLVWSGTAYAADHAEAPAATADPAADIADLYAWHDGTHIVAIVTFAGLGGSDPTALYDDQIVYGIHIDTDFDNFSEHDIWVRFGQDSAGMWGVMVEGMPGTGAPVVGPVETVISAPGGKVYAGLRDDPFFFDLTGFNDTLYTGTLSFTGVDAVAGANVTSIVIAMDQAATLETASSLQIWTSSVR